MNSLSKFFYFSLLYFLSSQINLVGEDTFSHSVKTEKKPWTSKSFLNDPSDFQFVIVSDRTGGMRDGVFPRAVDKLNELRPEFVITVGDMIKGGAGNRDVDKLMGEWEEFNSFIKGFDMPFFISLGIMMLVMRSQMRYGMSCTAFVTILLCIRMYFFYV